MQFNPGSNELLHLEHEIFANYLKFGNLKKVFSNRGLKSIL